MNYIEKMDSPLELIWDWSYEIEQTKIEDLYTKAKRDQWNADVEIDWSRSVDPGGKILDPYRMSMLQMEFFKKLSQSGILFDELYIDMFVDGKQIPFNGVEEIKGPFKAHTEAVKALGFKLLVKRAAIGQSKHVRVRPIFDNWVLKGSFLVVEEQITDKILKDIWSKAGLQVGLCDWRPGAPRSPPCRSRSCRRRTGPGRR